MRNFYVLTEAVAFLEERLACPVTRAEAAKHCHVSLSSLEKLFRFALHRSVGEYLFKRRLTCAARDLAGGATVLDTAMKYQYASPEGFSRAFRRLWGVLPSAFPETWKFTGLYPPLDYRFEEGGDMNMAGKKVDLSDAYGYFRENAGTQVICFDIRNLTGFNAVSRRAGDLAIREAARRIDAAASEQMLLLRIGGDEFALITGLRDPATIEALRAQVLADNGACFDCDGTPMPLSLWAGTTIVPEQPRYGAFFGEMQAAVDRSKA